MKAFDILNVKLKMDGVIVAVAHDEFKNKPFLKKKAFSERTTFLEENFTFLAQVLSLERKCFDVRGTFNEEKANNKGFYYRGL